MNDSPGNPFKAETGNKTPEADKIITVKVVKAVDLDGQRMAPGVTTKVSVKQWRSLSRFFEFVDGPEEHSPRNEKFAKERTKVVEERAKALAKAAALSLVMFMLFCFGFTAKAAPPSTFGSLSLPPMLALLPTNAAAWGGASVGCSPTQTNTWAALTNANGVPTNVITLTKFDEIFITLTGGNQSGSTGFTNTFTFWQGDGTLLNWDTNHPLFTLTLSGTSVSNGVLCTNISRNILGSAGYLVCGQIGNVTSALASTNLHLEIQVKPIRSGN